MSYLVRAQTWVNQVPRWIKIGAGAGTVIAVVLIARRWFGKVSEQNNTDEQEQPTGSQVAVQKQRNFLGFQRIDLPEGANSWRQVARMRRNVVGLDLADCQQPLDRSPLPQPAPQQEQSQEEEVQGSVNVAALRKEVKEKRERAQDRCVEWGKISAPKATKGVEVAVNQLALDGVVKTGQVESLYEALTWVVSDEAFDFLEKQVLSSSNASDSLLGQKELKQEIELLKLGPLFLQSARDYWAAPWDPEARKSYLWAACSTHCNENQRAVLLSLDLRIIERSRQRSHQVVIDFVKSLGLESAQEKAWIELGCCVVDGASPQNVQKFFHALVSNEDGQNKQKQIAWILNPQENDLEAKFPRSSMRRAARAYLDHPNDVNLRMQLFIEMVGRHKYAADEARLLSLYIDSLNSVKIDIPTEIEKTSFSKETKAELNQIFSDHSNSSLLALLSAIKIDQKKQLCELLIWCRPEGIKQSKVSDTLVQKTAENPIFFSSACRRVMSQQGPLKQLVRIMIGYGQEADKRLKAPYEELWSYLPRRSGKALKTAYKNYLKQPTSPEKRAAYLQLLSPESSDLLYELDIVVASLGINQEGIDWVVVKQRELHRLVPNAKSELFQKGSRYLSNLNNSEYLGQFTRHIIQSTEGVKTALLAFLAEVSVYNSELSRASLKDKLPQGPKYTTLLRLGDSYLRSEPNKQLLGKFIQASTLGDSLKEAASLFIEVTRSQLDRVSRKALKGEVERFETSVKSKWLAYINNPRDADAAKDVLNAIFERDQSGMRAVLLPMLERYAKHVHRLEQKSETHLIENLDRLADYYHWMEKLLEFSKVFVGQGRRKRKIEWVSESDEYQSPPPTLMRSVSQSLSRSQIGQLLSPKKSSAKPGSQPKAGTIGSEVEAVVQQLEQFLDAIVKKELDERIDAVIEKVETKKAKLLPLFPALDSKNSLKIEGLTREAKYVLILSRAIEVLDRQKLRALVGDVVKKIQSRVAAVARGATLRFVANMILIEQKQDIEHWAKTFGDALFHILEGLVQGKEVAQSESDLIKALMKRQHEQVPEMVRKCITVEDPEEQDRELGNQLEQHLLAKGRPLLTRMLPGGMTQVISDIFGKWLDNNGKAKTFVETILDPIWKQWVAPIQDHIFQAGLKLAVANKEENSEMVKALMETCLSPLWVNTMIIEKLQAIEGMPHYQMKTAQAAEDKINRLRSELKLLALQAHSDKRIAKAHLRKALVEFEKLQHKRAAYLLNHYFDQYLYPSIKAESGKIAAAGYNRFKSKIIAAVKLCHDGLVQHRLMLVYLFVRFLDLGIEVVSTTPMKESDIRSIAKLDAEQHSIDKGVTPPGKHMFSRISKQRTEDDWGRRLYNFIDAVGPGGASVANFGLWVVGKVTNEGALIWSIVKASLPKTLLTFSANSLAVEGLSQARAAIGAQRETWLDKTTKKLVNK